MSGVIKLNPSIFTDKRDALAVCWDEALRLWMEEINFEPEFEITPEQEEFFKDTAYAEGDGTSAEKGGNVLDPGSWGGSGGRATMRADTRTYRDLHPLKELRSTVPTPLEAANAAVGNQIPSDNPVVNLVNQFIAGAGKFGRARAVSPGGTPAIMRETVTAKQLADPAAYFRVVAGKDAYRDIVNSGVVRAERPTPPPGSPLKELVAARPAAFPSFAKGRPLVEYARGSDEHYVITTKDPSIKPSHVGRHGFGFTQFPTGPNGRHLRALPSAAVDVFEHVGEGDYAKVMSRGVPLYKPGDK